MSAGEAGSRLRLDFVSPLPPTRSGIADYSADLLPALAERCDLRVVRLEEEVSPEIEGRWQPVDTTHLGEDGRVPFYQMGNNLHHQKVLDLARSHPGILTLHDLFLHHLLVEQTLARVELPALPPTPPGGARLGRSDHRPGAALGRLSHRTSFRSALPSHPGPDPTRSPRPQLLGSGTTPRGRRGCERASDPDADATRAHGFTGVDPSSARVSGHTSEGAGGGVLRLPNADQEDRHRHRSPGQRGARRSASPDRRRGRAGVRSRCEGPRGRRPRACPPVRFSRP